MTAQATCNCEPAQATPKTGRVFRPNLNIVEDVAGFTVTADMPGVRAEDIEVNFENSTLTIYGKTAPRQTEGRMIVQEYGVGHFQRTIQIGESINAEGIEASVRDGVLTLRLPKIEAAKPRKIAVSAS